jgi:acyl dehydratase
VFAGAAGPGKCPQRLGNVGYKLSANSILMKIELPPASERLTNLAQRTFSLADQDRFAAISGDHNPMHVDAHAARRTQAGAPVVHGMNLLLWSLDAYAAHRAELPPLRALRAEFRRLVYLNDTVAVRAQEMDASRVRLQVVADDGPKSEFFLEFGEPVDETPAWAAPGNYPELPVATIPLQHEPAHLGGMGGRLSLRMTETDAIETFPTASRWLGVDFVRELAGTTYLVGMVSPGLHSIYSALALKSCKARAQTPEGLTFRVTKFDPRFGLITEEVAGRLFSGAIRAFLRTPPVAQPSMQSLAEIVAPDEFANSFALVVGGSRGLGELTAKLIARGGGRVAITWHSGSDDAQRVAGEIRTAGGRCETLHYDAHKDAAMQLASLTDSPTHAYYFATSMISRPRAGIFSAARLAEFLSIYAEGFWQLACALRARLPTVELFYPSTVFVDERPPGLTEYAMAKAAGETLCADINLQLAPTHVTVRRLPRMPTDQTASLIALESENALDVMLPIVRAVQSTRSLAS